jgi:DNA-binding NarL/FixJ family response regulator
VIRRKIVIVDDHPIVRQGLVQLIEQEADLTVCGEAEDVDEAKSVVSRTRPDLVLLDISLRFSNGLDLIKYVKANHPEIFVLILSLHEVTAYAERVLRIGARGFVSKTEAVENMLVAVREVLSGGIYISPPTRRFYHNADADVGGGDTTAAAYLVATLTDREMELFQLVGTGMNNSSIAESMKLSLKTIETYKAHIKRKLGLANTTELVERAVRWNMGRFD